MKTLFAKLFFLKISPLVKTAQTRIIGPEDMLPLPPDLDPRDPSMDQHEIKWNETPAKFLLSVLWSERGNLKWAYFNNLLAGGIGLMTPVFIHRFISLVSAGIKPENFTEAMVTGILMGCCGFLTGLIFQHNYYHALRAYQVVTNILNKRIFVHSLRLSQLARQKSQVGDIVNHMSSDTDAVADLPMVVGESFWSALTLVGAVSMLFYYIGISAVVPLVILTVLAPLTKWIAKRFTKLDVEMMAFRDHRVTLMTQTLNAIRVVKFFAWEKSVEREVSLVREKEIGSRRKLARAEVISNLTYLAVSTLVLFAALAMHAWRTGHLDAATIFTCISLFGLLEEPFGNLSRLISRTTNALVSAGRLLKFLSQEEVEILPHASSETPVGLKVKELSVTYENMKAPALTNINFTVNPGEALAIVGPVGCGKSTLLLTLMGEITKTGEVRYDGLGSGFPRFGYVSQEAYIINSTLLENISFGLPKVSGEDLRRALHNSCLDRDLKEWKTGLRTEIGEKGVNLSGGQKQRVSLARAYISNPQLLLLDDPLSAVDHETENLLCDRLLFGAWKDRTRIVVTHRLESLSRFDRVIFLLDGQVKKTGTLTELLQDPTFREFYSEHSAAPDKEKVAAVAAHPEVAVTAESRITEDEERETGAVKGSVYFDYIRALGGDDSPYRNLVLGTLAFGALAVTSLPILQQWWMSYYTSHQDSVPALPAVAVFGALGLIVLLASLVNNLFWLERGIRAGQQLHVRMLKSVLAAPIRFFDSTPVGRILQRFSRDIESVDIYLQWSFESAVNCFLRVLASLVLIIGVMPLTALLILPVMFLYYRVQAAYRRPAREAKRLDSVARSPRYAHFKETLMGLCVIRAYGKTDWFMDSFYEKLENSNRMFYNHYMLNRWFSTRIPMIGGIISIGTSIGLTLSARAGLITPGTAGLVAIYSLSFWGYLNWAVRIFADIESRMTSIERLRFFANLPAEVDVRVPAAKELPASWPERGEVVADNIQVRYASHLPLVLKGISFHVKAGSRVGIVGRTGSGKSTLFQTLFRFIELDGGRILIDGVDIASVPLERLRRSLAIVPQDPTLFLGTIRNNLDRYDEYTDAEVENALRKASLWSYISSLPSGLQAAVAEGGNNLSQGQRQLLCMARALLTKAKVIVMDEATASVDVQTDTALQKVIRESLKGVTLLIIAHRLGTVADSDQIIEISDGQLKI